MISLFIDANVYLRFYAYTDDDLVELEKLEALVEVDQLRIFKNVQLEDEIERNREKKIVTALDVYKKSATSAQIPRFAVHFDEAKELLDASKALQKAKSELSKRIDQEIGGGELRADKLIKQLLEAAVDAPVSDDVLQKARWRQIRGNPPGKSDSIGDQIHWEALLASDDADGDLHLVSFDGDFASPLSGQSPNRKLAKEWEAKTGGALHVYNSLGDFAKAHFGDISLPSDVKKSAAISKLVTTTNFETTHKQVNKLEAFFEEITAEEALILLQAMIDNNQISWIADDSDVKSFYKKLYEKFFFETTPEMDEVLKAKAGYLDIIPF